MNLFFNSPAGVALVTIISTALVATATGVIKMVVDVARLAKSVEGIAKGLDELKNSEDVMRWSEFGRSERNSVGRHKHGGSAL